jgi:hypothetical protein
MAYLNDRDVESRLNKTVIRVINPFSGWLKFAINISAVLVSWYFNKSILWAIFHYLFGSIYLIYSLLVGRFTDGGFLEIINSYL